MENEGKDLLVTVAQMERWVRDMTETHIARVTLQVPGPNSVVFEGGVVGHHAKRLCALLDTLKKGQEAVQQMLDDEVRIEFPDVPRPAVFYEGWRIGSEKPERDLFTSAGEPCSTRSDAVKIGEVRTTAR